MAITSASFFMLCFVALFTVTIFNKHNHIKKNLLLILSYYFYMTINWQFAVILFSLSTINYLAGNYIASSSNTFKKKFTLTVSVIVSLLVLFYFKYLGFFVESFYDLLKTFGIEGKSPFVDIILPIGISFMTFQAITYPLDIYAKRLKETSSYSDFLLFMSFFPQVLSGPIVRASYFMPQLRQQNTVCGQDMMAGLTLIIRGLIKKIVFADTLASHIVDPAFNNPSEFSSVFLILALFAYSFQVYMDLSGYTDIAVGLAKMLGYKLPINFNRPYLATSIANFWQRWHITMSSFFRDYLYEAISKIKYGNIYLNLLIVFIAIGIWHGAGWNFVLYGFIHGSLVGWEHYWKNRRDEKELPPIIYRGLTLFIRVIQIFIIIVLTRLLFRGDSISASVDFLYHIANSSVTGSPLTWLSASILLLSALLHFTPIQWRDNLMLKLENTHPIIYGVGAALLIYALTVFNSGKASFIYFQF